ALHPAGRVAEHLVPVVETNLEGAVAQGLDDLALHLDLLFLLCDDVLLPAWESKSPWPPASGHGRSGSLDDRCHVRCLRLSFITAPFIKRDPISQAASRFPEQVLTSAASGGFIRA